MDKRSIMKYERSQKLFEASQEVIPGGVNSPVRAFSSVGMNPPFIKRGKGAYIYDEDGNKYIDYVGSWGPLILGHCHPEVVENLKAVLETGTSFGAPTEIELKIAELITGAIPSVEMIRMVNSGTEATMTALRLARGYTGRNKIVKFNGNYHGHSDGLLIKAGSGALTHGVPNSPGVTPDVAKNTITAKYNDIEGIMEIFKQQGEEIAAVIIEPIAGNMGVVPMTNKFAHALRKITEDYGALLIFDEVMTGFRVSFGGAQSLYQIKPDLTCFGKIIGGGLPVGAFGGKREIMEHLSPVGPVYQAGTLSGNPLAMTAGYTTLSILHNNSGIYEELEKKAQKLEKGFKKIVKELQIDASFNRVGSMLCMFFTKEKVSDLETASTSNTEIYSQYFRAMLSRGVYLAPTQFETMFISDAHGDVEINRTIEAAYEGLKEIRNNPSI
ncbi:glutamate-1-semialdehyde-2,1-aminomutase [Alkaliphilus metalliredigens QYMF]|uniref:Glutamate-1-semialdehyde 2,1-aminomutase n=1 Tax=Alkaliphilus metalliredigens (strain QYMF) TaxID=293826 RepID=GSA_ALKMQ|nr:glutamate-1-semialdehyde 2,1-aminomutase [Alkaliphilus metalliredigens]A6TJD8.1 RecName: Full=Glutamate-1-semialdehyde 2,1-aminomutase; Short=GSA; AltName: Full=Glutamate-1-semialdehyde aminotransferase; Short=GSA-AT [Alkaliphilus metalliredigens QYMF]ABR46306.1 glutamate-1-semialdehyde-2,1-aminomutase [Alkaliphilus metalliredigens QYMF]